MVSVRFRWAPPEYQEPGTVYRTLVELATGEPTVLVDSPRATVDIEFSSSLLPLWRAGGLDLGRATLRFRQTSLGQDSRRQRLNPAPPRRDKARASIWFTGENEQPPFGDWDGYLSFNMDSLGGRNAYFPLWWEAIGAIGRPAFNFLGKPMTVEACMSSRVTDMSCRPGFVCAFIGNPTPMRLHAVSALEAFGSVDVFGHAVGKPVANKLEIASRYKFVLCFENDYYPGYVTEKVFDAWGTGAVPIWWGCDPAGYINAAAVINLANYSGLEEMGDRIADVASSHDDWEAISSSPILTRPPDVEPAISLIQRTLTS